MSFDMFDLSKERVENKVQAVKIFTDREDPQEAFERKFRLLSKDEAWRRTFYVLSYYGIGGIGKSSFVDKLCRVIKGIPGNECRLLDRVDCHYIVYDFGAKGAVSDKLSILLQLRKQLVAVNPKFTFQQFDAAVLFYGQKTGRDLQNDPVASPLLESNPWLSLLIDTVESVPGIDKIVKAVKLMDQALSAVKGSIAKEKREAFLLKLQQMEPRELLENLHSYFVADMQNNMWNIAQKPLVIFLDTYEKFIDAENSETVMITEDMWLRKGPNSVIKQVPGILWVITGREKLHWSEDDQWDEMETEHALEKMTEDEKEALAKTHLEQHLLGDLSLKDATSFLQTAGVEDEKLCAQIHRLTKGTPLFLDICVETYQNLISERKTPHISDFGKDVDQLVTRYLKGLNSENREMTYFLSCLGTFTDEIAFDIASNAKNLKYFSKSLYQNFVAHSFIIPGEGGTYYVHDTVRLAALANADKDLTEEIHWLKLNRLQKIVPESSRMDDASILANHVATLIEAPVGYAEFEDNLRPILKEIEKLYDTGEVSIQLQLSRQLFQAIKKKYPNSALDFIARAKYCDALRNCGLYSEALMIIDEIPVEELAPNGVDIQDWLTVQHTAATIYNKNKMFEKARDLAEDALGFRMLTLDPYHPDTLKSLACLARAYAGLGEEQKALELREKALELSEQTLGADHPDTLNAMGRLANSYSSLGEEQKALELREKALELSEQKLGAEHLDTQFAMHNLANSYSRLGEEQKALELRKKVLELSEQKLGAEHPDTRAAMHNLAISYSSLGEEQKALELRKKVLELSEQTLGADHPDTRAAMNNLANSYSRLGEEQKAQELRERWDVRVKVSALCIVVGTSEYELACAKEKFDKETLGNRLFVLSNEYTYDQTVNEALNRSKINTAFFISAGSPAAMRQTLRLSKTAKEREILSIIVADCKRENIEEWLSKYSLDMETILAHADCLLLGPSNQEDRYLQLDQFVSFTKDLFAEVNFIALDFVDIANVLKDAGLAYFGRCTVQESSTDGRLRKLSESGIMQKNILSTARRHLIHIKGSYEFSLDELEAILQHRPELTTPDLIIGAMFDDDFTCDQVQVSILTSGFDIS